MSEIKPSKSARKREYIALQKLGESLIALKPSDLEKIPLTEELLDALHDARKISANGALRRQKQYIGKLMALVDPEPIKSALAALRDA